ncbi:zona pellucida sperm-binding protein 3 isoform X1 [Salmo salar]|uniref:Zona pellucida sperm-binding protein 3 n=1 Tax=Salmo salar TaxID=8030 RepID=A0A1S3PP63_SALSA|nr:zona pellucida sperm-binding protein 3-like isoform X1 [Salmo salar]|eukprot:XP_014029475.1 PREDICTED: zona pellucida sperm-binding protein 3-like isoform X1 [Salmo salar]
MGQLERGSLYLFVLLCLGWVCEAHWNSQRGPARQPVSLSYDDVSPTKPELKEQVQDKAKPQVTARPADPQSVVKVVLTPPELVRSVGARCGESRVWVEAKLDLFGTGQLVKAEDVSLGGCVSTELDLSAQVLLFESELHACGSVLTMTEDYLVYAFTLIYTPTPEGVSSIVRTNDATVCIECHYLRRLNVSSNALRPTWLPYGATKVAEDSLTFTLVLMNDDWKYERSSNVYFLGDIIHLAASVQQYHHVPMRVFVDSCVATLVPDTNSAPIYDFIHNHGCVTDALQTGSVSQFLVRSQLDTLHLQLDAFRFQQQTSPNIYITCSLKASLATAPLDMEHKACSFALGSNRWVGADGDDEVCGCCQTSCGQRKGRSLPSDSDVAWEEDAMLGPIFIQDTYVKWDQEVHAGEQQVQAEAQHSHMLAEDPSEAGVSPKAVVVGLVMVLGLLCVGILVTVLYMRNKPNTYSSDLPTTFN